MSNLLPNETPIIIEMTPEGKDGLDGNGIASISLVSTVGLVKTYRILYTNDDHFDFEVTDGSAADLVWGNITGTLTDQTDLAEALTAIRTALASKAEASDVYDKTAIDAALSAIDTAIGQKANADAVYTKTEADALLDGKADTGDSYTKSEDDALLAQKANSADVYTKTEVDAEIADIDSAIAGIGTALTSKADASDLTALANRVSADEQTIAGKADASSVYTKTEADALLAQKADTADVTSALAQKADADDLADAVADIADLDLAKAPVITETVSGAMVTITDGAEAPVKALSVGIEPVQDLHGYDAPWPAGGGVNIMPKIVPGTYTNSGITVDVADNGVIHAYGQKTVESGVTVNLTISKPFGKQPGQYVHLRNNYANSNISFGVGGTGSTLAQLNRITPNSETKEETSLCTFYLASSVTDTIDITFQPSVELTNAVTDWTPYANICPITGHTQAVVRRTGKNLLPKTTASSLTRNGVTFTPQEDGSIKVSGTATAQTDFKFHADNSLTVRSGGTYTYSAQGISANVQFVVGGLSNTSGLTYAALGTTQYGTSKTQTLNAGTLGYCFIRVVNGATVDTVVYPMFQTGSTATDFEPYQGQNISVTFPSEAGTVYGGVVDLASRTLTVDRAMVDLGTLDWVMGSASLYANIADAKLVPRTTATDSICSIYKATTFNLLSQHSSDNVFAMHYSTGRVLVYDSKYNDAVSFKTAVTGQTLVYELAVSLTYTLTPQQMTLLLGQNHIWSDTGDVTVEYRADTKLFIDNAIAKSQHATRSLITGIEASMTATQNYTTGALIIVGDDLYKATANIASGGTLTAGTNVAKITLSQYILEQLSA